MRRSSKRAIRSAFQFRRWTCQQPRAKAVRGINAVHVVLDFVVWFAGWGGIGWDGRRYWCMYRVG